MMLADDLRADGEPDHIPAGVVAALPRKGTGAGALIRDSLGRILFVVPNYRRCLEIPGGIVEDDESPRAACAREVREETGLVIDVGPLLVVDWVPARGHWGDLLVFVFDGGVIDAELAVRLTPQDDELDGLALLTLAEASDRLLPSQRRRFRTALDAVDRGTPCYTEFGRARPSGGSPGDEQARAGVVAPRPSQ
jgi:ADP-ribose pyrophosphatase YjhB (NUDIX family)